MGQLGVFMPSGISDGGGGMPVSSANIVHS